MPLWHWQSAPSRAVLTAIIAVTMSFSMYADDLFLRTYLECYFIAHLNFQITMVSKFVQATLLSDHSPVPRLVTFALVEPSNQIRGLGSGYLE